MEAIKRGKTNADSIIQKDKTESNRGGDELQNKSIAKLNVCTQRRPDTSSEWKFYRR